MRDEQTDRPAEPRLLARVHAVARARHLSLRTEEVYRSWIVRFVRFHGLRHPAQGSDRHLDSHSMHDHDLHRIEQTLGLSLPAAYRAAMLDYPFPPTHEAAQLWMPDNAAIVLEMNRPIPERRLAGKPWPPHLVFIGTDGGEEDFVLDVRTAAAPVLAYERESGDVRTLAPDFAAWLAMLRDWQAEMDHDAAEMRAAYARKRWWQFWIRRYPP